MKKTWNYLQNQFANATLTSYKKAIILSNFHHATLLQAEPTEPLLTIMLDRYTPLHNTLELEYNKWKNAGGSQVGQTLNLTQQLALASNKINVWDVAVQMQFPKGTVQYKNIFPQGRKPFNRQNIDDRVNAYSTLSLAMGGYASLASVKAQVDATYTILDDARVAQEGAKGNKSQGSDLVEAARVAAMKMMYRNVGYFIENFSDNPNYIENFFDLSTLRSSRQSIFTGTLDPAETEAVLIHTFMEDDEISLENKGDQAINFYLSNSPAGTNSDAILVNPMEEKIVPVSDFNVSDYAFYRYLTAVNTSTTLPTKYEVELM